MDYVKPQGVVESMLAGGVYKLQVPPRHLILRGMLAGAYLGIGRGPGSRRRPDRPRTGAGAVVPTVVVVNSDR